MPLPDDRWYWVVRDYDEAVVLMAPGELMPLAIIDRDEEEAGEWATRMCEAMNRTLGVTT